MFNMITVVDHLWFLDKRVSIQPRGGELSTFCQISTKKPWNIPRPGLISMINTERSRDRALLYTRLNT